MLSDRALGLSLTSIMFIRLYLCGSQRPADRRGLDDDGESLICVGKDGARVPRDMPAAQILDARS
jgi:hypothetical protein